MAESLSLILKRELKEQGITVNALAKKVGMPQPSLYRIVSGKVKEPKYETVARIAQALNLKPAQLYGLFDPAGISFREVPIIPWDMVPEYKARAMLNDSELLSFPKVPVPLKVSETACALRMVGTLHEPVFLDGDILFFDTGRMPLPGELTITLIKDKISIRRIVTDLTGVYLQAVNPKGPEEFIVPAVHGNLVFGTIVGKFTPLAEG